MRSTRLHSLSLIVVVGLILSGMLACDFGGGATKPTVTVSSPESFTEVSVGAEVEVVSTVRDTKGVTKVELAVDGVLFSTETSPNPQGDTSWTLTQTWVATDAGVHNLTVTAYNVDGLASDPWGIAVRVVEGGGPGATGTATEATATLPPPVQPDLTITEFYVDPANVAYGGWAQATFTIRNAGTAPAGDCTVQYICTESATCGCSLAVGPLAVGAEITSGCTVGPFYASYGTYINVDTDNVVAESNEDNNYAQFMVNVAAAALPDLTIEDLDLEPPNPGSGGYATASIVVANDGSGDAGPYQLQYYWGASNSCDWWMDPLPAGAEATVSCHVGPFGGPYTTYAYADTGAEVTESNENNNRRELYVEVS